ncbi:LysR family transcriptional regulator [Photobacterium rosenbergii]|uniref:LysR family transcriptional regulator n=1 Tax=Photobacterium rosenbergii TaxID=294936 RepID=UPI001C99051A|nr:LysR family transcriptional regulator [Photobacterium rosenbergii]MBY5944075.1 LysR family transcriptional regulator [Photobacterium rosenbergii]
MEPRLDELNLNLMRLLKALVEKKSTKLAAEQLGMSQATASRGLASLKEVFGEMLFVRKAHGIEPSAMAIKLAAVVDDMLSPIQDVLEDFAEFSSEDFNGNISIVADSVYYEEQGAKLISQLYKALPNASFSFFNWDESSQEEMLSGKFDYCIVDNEMELGQDIYLKPLFSEKTVLIARENHPILSLSYDWDEIADLPLVILPPPVQNTPLTSIEVEYLRRDLTPHVLLRSYNIQAACQLVSETNAIMFSSISTANNFKGVTHYPAPPLSHQFNEFTIYGGYLQTNRNHPLYRYLHNTISTIFNP